MRNRSLWIALISAGIVGSVAIVIVITAALTPGQINPAFAAAVEFVEAAERDDDAAATVLMTPELAAYIAQNCPDGSVSACVQSYTPPEWGDLISAVFRRAAPEGPNWDVDLIATYQYGQGFSGVCIFTRMVPDGEGWKVAEYAGFVACGDPATRNMATNPGAPNRAPSAS
ncbi:MAG TPA: hypothetical protein VER79_00030 [Candidatus Limnocylindrales bacterium]|nr:hypothetical protein [Candidatus Limnocylindrales bacterium]